MEDFQKSKDEIKTKMTDKLLNYVRDGTIQYNSQDFMKCYSIIQDFGNSENYAKELLNFHNEVIEQATNESYEKIKDLSGDEFIDAFITYTDRLNFIILKMSHTFSFLSFYYIKFIKSKDLGEISLDLYKKNFFDKLQDKLFPILKELTNKEGKDENIENKIKTIMKIIDYLDFIKPKIISNKVKNSSEWIEDSKEEAENPKVYQKKWNDFKA